MPTAEYVFCCHECGQPFATRNPDAWLMENTTTEGNITRRYCDCGHLLTTTERLT